jgi:hypothetical protein
MPIEIRELVIRATIDSGEKNDRQSVGAADQERNEMVAECVEQVLEILRQKAER